MEKRPRGRPVGVTYPKVRSIRLSENDDARLQALAEKWETTGIEVLRRLIREAARREGVDQ